MSNPVSEEEQFLSTGKVAKMFDVRTQTVGEWIRDDKLKAQKINGRWKVSVAEVKRFGQAKYNVPEGESNG
jgi:predicted site-specific integrase-resolvase